MAASTLFPLPIAISQLKRHFAGLGDVLEAVSCYSGQTLEELAEEHIRASQAELERALQMPFFVTRYCTEEVAARPGGSTTPSDPALVMGTDYDRIIEPLDYIIEDWTNGKARVRAPWKPVDSVALFRITFAEGGHIVDLPLEWLNRNSLRGILTLMPHGIGITGTQYFRMLLLFPFYRGGGGGDVIPHVLHLRYAAGLVDAHLGEEDEYDAEAAVEPQKDTKWDQGLVQQYQRMIGLHASAPILRELASEIDKGGASVSFAGLSETINPGVISGRADANEEKADELAAKLRDQLQGPTFVTV